MQRNIIHFFIFIVLINSSFSHLAFKFPHAFKLNNKNIFVIHQLGATVCDETFTESIDRVLTFSESEKITTDQALSKVTSVLADDYVICLLNDRIYIFNEEGYFLKKDNQLITELNVEYYSLINYGKIGDYLYFVIGFAYDRELYLYSYKYQITNKSLNKYYSLEKKNSNYLDNNAFTCHYMKYSSSYLIACLYYRESNGIVFNFFDISTTSLCVSTKKSTTTYSISEQIKYIRAASLPGDSRLLIGWLNSDRIPNYWMYDINYANSIYSIRYFVQSYCKFISHGFQINYYPEKNGIIYTCLFQSNTWVGANANILVESLNTNYQQTNYTYKYIDCDIHGYSIVYLDDKNDYYIISDVECSNKLIPMNLLFGNLKDEEITVHTEYVKEVDEIIEEEKSEEMEKQPEEEYIEGYEIWEENNVISFDEEKQDLFEEEKLNTYEEEIIDFFEEEKINIIINEEEKEREIYDEKLKNIEEEENIYYIKEEKIEKEELNLNEEKYKEMININFEEEEENENEEIKDLEKEKENIGCEQLEKCELCNEESVNKNLCIKCNNLKGYYFLNIYSIPKKEIGDEYIDCVNDETKPSKFYFDEDNKDYRLCYETCATCDTGGDWEINNCKTCEKNYIFRPDIISTSNCVFKCPYYYYYSNANKYKCTEEKYCPLNYILFIKEKGKCTNDCKNDDTYKYQYDNQCLKECPIDTTISDHSNFICRDKNPDLSVLTETFHTYFNENITDSEMDYLTEIYMKNFDYTSNHISIYKSNNYTIVFYKNTESISNLSLGIPKINFENCYTKIKEKYSINDDLIISLELEKIDKDNDKIISFSVYDPRNGKKILINDICKNEPVIVEENLEERITDIETFIYLTNQGIDLLDPNSDFFTDLCFHFKSPIDGKDIPLKERFKLFFPNISLCEKGCTTKGINTKINTSICECTLNNLINNDFLGDNIFFKSTMAELRTFFQDTNIEILRCYKDLFYGEFYLRNHGCFIIFGLILIQTILAIIYYNKYIFAMRKYLYNLMQTYLVYLENKGITLSNPFNNLKEQIQNNLIQFKANPNKKQSSKIIRKSMNNIPNEKIKRNKISHKNITNKKMSLDELLNQRSNINSDIQLGSNGQKIPEEMILPKILINNNNISIKNNLIIGELLNIDMEEYISTDPNDMDYDNAIRRDKRSFCVYFIDNLKIDLLILNIFCNYEKLNPWPIKFLLFILNVNLYFFVNGLFFTEDYLEEMLYDKEFSFLDFTTRFMDRIYYITLIGIIISYVMNFFFFEENVIKKLFKREKNNMLILKYEMAQIIKNIKNRYNLFIAICFLVGIFVWYYVFCFNNIYPSMKKEWIITSVIIIFAMQFLSFLKILLETIIRFIAIKCKSERLFKISQFLS